VKTWKVALLAFVAMCLQDILATAMVVFESRYNALAAGAFDVAGWLAGIVCMGLAIDSIIRTGWRTRRSLAIIAAVSAANFLGTVAGVAIAEVLTNHH
jgi:hypothetical protein